jgi:hypothetical protein
MYGKKVVIACLCLCSTHGVISEHMQVLDWAGERASEGSLQHGGEAGDLWELFTGSRAWPGLDYKKTIIVGDKQQ